LATFSIHLSNGVRPLLSFKWVAIITVEGGSSKAERSQYTALVTPQTTAPRAINVTMIHDFLMETRVKAYAPLCCVDHGL
jgi:hypothetical protein